MCEFCLQPDTPGTPMNLNTGRQGGVTIREVHDGSVGSPTNVASPLDVSLNLYDVKCSRNYSKNTPTNLLMYSDLVEQIYWIQANCNL